MSPRPRLDDDQQHAILDAAVAVIARRGLPNTRLADVATAVGRSTGTLQHYFGSHEGLVRAAILRLNAVSGARAAAVSAAIEDPWERLTALVDETLGVGEGWDAEWRVWLDFWSACSRDPELAQETTAVYAIWRDAMRRTVQQGIADGMFDAAAPVEEVVSALLALIDGAAIHVLLGIGGLDHDRARAIALRLAASYLTPPGAP
jgi:AcrR family transcriptional regulator